MNYSSPFAPPKKPVEKEIVPKKQKPIISRGSAKSFSGVSCNDSQRFWLDRYVLNLIQSYSYPPQCIEFGYFTQFLPKTDRQRHLDVLKVEFQKVFPYDEEDVSSSE